MTNALIRKLEVVHVLTGEDKATLLGLCGQPRCLDAHQDIILEGDRPNDVHLVMEGIACRYKSMADGRRQILALLVPGDIGDLHVALLGEMDHSMATITACTLVTIPREAVLDLSDNHPRIARALWWATMVDEAILRQWLVGVGRRPANEGLAHFFCEMFVRLRTVGLTEGYSYSLPLSRPDLADILGLTSVHISRTLTELHAAGLVFFQKRQVTILDWDRLQALCDFNPNYLHLTPRRFS